MPQYSSYSSSVAGFVDTIQSEFLDPIVDEGFEEDRGHGIRQTLPGKSDDYRFSQNGFEADVFPNRREVTNYAYEGSTITVNRVAANPERYKKLSDALVDLWWDVFGDNPNKVTHPGEPPISREELHDKFEELSETVDLIESDPMLTDLLAAIKDKNHRLAARFLYIDDPMDLFDPTSNHELNDLFTNGDIHIVYQDRDIALLKPEYNHEITEDVLSQQMSGIGRVEFRGEVPEPAFVVGRDDTPAGLFGHIVDGTRLEHDQEVSRDYINDVMGFDRAYSHDESLLSLEDNERVRLQGDLGVRAVSERVDRVDGRCNLPVDNHLVMLSEADLSDGESKDQEPIKVDIPLPTAMNIMHDEHDEVVTKLDSGVYEFYLLPRGLQPESERPDWPEP